MADPRPVRIPRRPAGSPDRRRRYGDDADRRFWDADAPGSSSYEANTGGTSRAVRLYVFFGAALAVIFVLFVALAATSPAPGVSQNLSVYAWLTALTLALGAGGAVITILRAPRGASFGVDSVLVTERLGRRRRWPAPPALQTRVLRNYPGGLLGFEPTELVELSDAAGHRAQYLVGRGFFDRLDSPR